MVLLHFPFSHIQQTCFRSDSDDEAIRWAIGAAAASCCTVLLATQRAEHRPLSLAQVAVVMIVHAPEASVVARLHDTSQLPAKNALLFTHVFPTLLDPSLSQPWEKK